MIAAPTAGLQFCFMNEVSKQTFDTLRLIRSDKIGPKTFADLIKIFGTPTKALDHLLHKQQHKSKIAVADVNSIKKELEKTEQ